MKAVKFLLHKNTEENKEPLCVFSGNHLFITQFIEHTDRVNKMVIKYLTGNVQ